VLRLPSARRLLFIIAAATSIVGGNESAQAQTDPRWLGSRMNEWYASASRMAPGEWGIAIADQSGQMLWSFNAEASLMPASAVKLFTTGYARSVLGGNARRATRMVGTGMIDPSTGEWLGDWALELNGDPSLERAQGSGPTLYDLAAQVAEAGIRRLNGPLRVRSADGPATAVYPSVWSSRHQGRLFAPPVGPLTIHENIVWFTVRPGRPGERVKLMETAPSGISSLVSVRATTRSGRRSRLRLLPRTGGGWVITGTLGVRAAPRRLTAVANDPKLVLGAVWATALRRAGVRWNRLATSKASFDGTPRVLAEVASPLGIVEDGIDQENRRTINSWRTAGSEPSAGTLVVPSAITSISAPLAWLTMALEAAVAITFLAPLPERWRWLRDATLIGFIATTYPLAPVLGFGWLLVCMGAMQSRLRSQVRIFVYVLTFAGIALLEERSALLDVIRDAGIF
jgi:hypothetical protein